ncbi:DUF1189 domain-containing protein [Pradoshia eiseniae]|uniref:DUF1189 domain-containing protein n=1 Tax=Pradoshia eiseniae TaxID=2064768 RepID=A0A2S7N392_9BACI|nr:DUF1189 domain-containing protein [Pradoshia eiseniae]PQD96496.1 DUF1189 domain-containing protein [Pradoshia eiseniae]
MNIFAQLVKSLYSPKDIAKYRFQGIGKTIFYVFFLTFIMILPLATYTTMAALTNVSEFSTTLKTDIPPFEIKDGTLYSDAETPQRIEKDDFTLQFDSTGTLNASDLNNSSDVTVGLLKNKAVLVVNGQAQELEYSLIPGLNLNNESASEYIENAKASLYLVIALVILVMYVMTAALQFLEVTLLAYFGGLFAAILGRRINFGQQWRLAAYSFTLSVVFFTIMEFIQVPVVGDFYVKWFISLMMLYMAIKELPVPKKPKA